MDSLTLDTVMRDPVGHAEDYTEFFDQAARYKSYWKDRYPSLPLHSQVSVRARRVTDDQHYLIRQYGAGVSIELIQQEAIKRIARMEEDALFVRTQGGDDWRNFHPFFSRGHTRESFGFLALVLLSLDSNEAIKKLRHFISRVEDRQNYLFDLLLKACDPMHSVSQKYLLSSGPGSWTVPILRALASPVEERPAALAKHMNNWQRLMRPHHWSPQLKNATPRMRIMFYDFAFEVALAACIYDIDDSTFRDHPYYPRDLADYYRQHIRHSRDQWRPLHVGADLPITLPPPPRKTDLAKSRRKGLARWVELIADGDIDATEEVVKIIGNPRKIFDLLTLMQNLSDNDIMVYADWQDDDSVEIQAGDLSEERGLGIFDGPPGPPNGPFRCQATLLSWSTWLAERGYLLVDIDDRDSDHHAVVVKTAFYPELQQLSERLGIPVRLHGADINLT